MFKIKAIFCDIYGTILCEDDPDNEMPPRRGFAEFAGEAKAAGIKLISTSDADLTNLRFDISETFEDRAPFGPEVFDEYYRLAMVPKDYSILLINLSVAPEELLIVGNNECKDLSRAPQKSNKILVPTYQGLDNDLNFYIYCRQKISRMKNIHNFLN